MPIIDGEKYACQSCIKGHRVSGCQHVDRELTHINPKGRPVKQCEHCRGARKAKSHHARCDCGSKKDKEAKDKAKADQPADLVAGSMPYAAADESGCCCFTGSKCTCGMKKEPLTLKLDTSFQKQLQQHGRAPKPRLSATHSESHLTVFANGHHKPCHRLNNSAHTSGAPYKIPRAHPLHGQSQGGHSHSSSLGHFPSLHSQRARDDLGLGEPSSFPQYSASVDNLLLNNPLFENDGTGDASGFFYNQPAPSNSGAASDHSSPVDVQSADAFGYSPWPWTATQLGNQQASQFSLEALSASPTAVDYLSNFDSDFAIPSAGLNPTPMWSAGDLPLDPSKLTKTITPPISLSGDSNRPPSNPGLTSGSSGAQSEADDTAIPADGDAINAQSNIADPYLLDEVLNYRLSERPAYRVNDSGSRWPDYRQPPTSVPASESDCMKSTQQAIFPNMSPAVELDTPFTSVGIDTKSMLYTAGPMDYKAATYPSLGNAPRSLTMPSSPADQTAWPSSMSVGGNGFDLSADDFNFNNTVDLPTNYQYMS